MAGEQRLLGFAGMVAAGIAPETAWAAIHEETQQPHIQAVFDNLKATEDGRAALQCAAARWAELGFPPPWEP